MITVPDRWLAASLHRKAVSATMSPGWPTRPPGDGGGGPITQARPVPDGPGRARLGDR